MAVFINKFETNNYFKSGTDACIAIDDYFLQFSNLEYLETRVKSKGACYFSLHTLEKLSTFKVRLMGPNKVESSSTSTP